MKDPVNIVALGNFSYSWNRHWNKFVWHNQVAEIRLCWSGQKGGLQLVGMQTCPGEMFLYLTKLLETFPAHRSRAKWQYEQLQNLLDNLPLRHVSCIHDYSENYSCQDQDQIKSLYCGQTQASIHVTILHRNVLLYFTQLGAAETCSQLLERNWLQC